MLGLTWFCLERASNGKLNSQNRVRVAMTDAIAPSIERSNIVHDGASPDEMPCRRCSGNKLRRITGVQGLIPMAVFLGRIGSIAVREFGGRFELRQLFLLLLVVIPS